MSTSAHEMFMSMSMLMKSLRARAREAVTRTTTLQNYASRTSCLTHCKKLHLHAVVRANELAMLQSKAGLLIKSFTTFIIPDLTALVSYVSPVSVLLVPMPGVNSLTSSALLQLSRGVSPSSVVQFSFVLLFLSKSFRIFSAS